MMKRFLFSPLILFQSISFSLIPLMVLPPLIFARNMDPTMEDEVETLAVIAVSGEVIEETPRDLHFPTPELSTDAFLNQPIHWALSSPPLEKRIVAEKRILSDQTAKTIHLLTPVQPLKTERPLYPRRAREQGWHGRTIVQVNVLSDGTVGACSVQESSGYQLLDDQAIKAATKWTFIPAKNGGFPVSTTVNIPIQYDLVD